MTFGHTQIRPIDGEASKDSPPPPRGFSEKFPKRIRILFLVTEDWYFVSHRLPLARACRRLGWDVIVATRVGIHDAQIRDEGFTVVSAMMRRAGRRPTYEMKTIAELIGLYRSVRPDIVHHVGLKPVIYGSVAALFCRPKAVINALAGMGYIFTGESLLLSIARRLIRGMLRVCLLPKRHWLIVQNNVDASVFLDGGMVRPEKLRVIRGSGVDIEKFRPTDSRDAGTPVVSVVGRLLRDKGIREAVLAARELQRRGVRVIVRLVGAPDPGNPTSISEQSLRQWQREGCVEWTGYVDDMVGIWKSSDIAVLPSYREGLPKSLIEAAASGVPIVTTDVPGCRDTVEDGVTGILVRTYDWLGLADAIEKLVNSPDLRRAMGKAGRERAVLNFAEDVVVAQTIDLYQHALEAANIPGNRAHEAASA